MKIVSAITLSVAFLSGSVAFARDAVIPTIVPFQAEALDAAAMAEKTVAEKEPFLLQRLTSLKSATLNADISTKTDAGNVALTKGARLILAVGLADKKEYYCSGFDPKSGAPGWPTDTAKVQWVCLLDSDSDGAFDTSLSTMRNNGARLPSFSRVLKPQPIFPAAYAIDAEADRIYFQSALKYEKTFNIYGRAFFYKVIQLPGDTAWHDIVSSLKGVQGGYTAVKQDSLPQEFTVLGTKVALVAKSETGMTIKPVSAPRGIVSYGVSTVY